jgi:hypothetical protein
VSCPKLFQPGGIIACVSEALQVYGICFQQVFFCVL